MLVQQTVFQPHKNTFTLVKYYNIKNKNKKVVVLKQEKFKIHSCQSLISAVRLSNYQ